MLTVIQQALGIKTRIESDAEKEVLFTFDDGPDPLVTGKILDMLDTAGAKAVFFVVGNRIHKAEHMLREVLDRGHLIGNHSYTHWLGKPPSSAREYLADIEKCQQRIFDACGYTPVLFRPPLGAVNLATIRTARCLNLQIYKWSFDTNDWRLRDDDTARAQGTELAGKLAHRDVILMHDDNVHTPLVVEEMLRLLTSQRVDLSSFVSAKTIVTNARQSA
jgi:peptidoglycan/xylan/chitin deacetylase (PgdA/CDA1 family)